MARINADDYEAFRQFLEDACGILLGDNKHYLVQSRLGRMVSEAGVKSLGELVAQLRRERSGGAMRERVVEAMTTNETLWFRDNHPFKILSEIILPECAERRQRTPRIWSAACSTGQEPYSISMTVQDYLAKNPGSISDAQIIATDISPAVLAEAKEGYYDPIALARGLPADVRDRYFEKDTKHWEERWQIRADIRKRVRFTQGNLLSSYAALGRFDVIFCRNVLIYFSSESKVDIIRRMAAILNPGGYLLLGAAEAITQYSDAFDMVRCNPGVVYRKKA
ncbi:MAG TPA: protein-glutamate O-methyltransferase CheR [Gammaproteobacteria bacterium]|nr:protein-glutamate O-methyltransferase CheR [Gammaproteobacteria bacterium]